MSENQSDVFLDSNGEKEETGEHDELDDYLGDAFNNEANGVQLRSR